MGSRSRNNVGHIKRAKGAPTPQAPQNGEPERGGPPASTINVFPHGFLAGLSDVPGVAGACLDLYFAIPAGQVVVRLPAGTWPLLAKEVEALLENAPDAAASARAAAAGIHLPGRVDLEAEAKAHKHMKEGPA